MITLIALIFAANVVANDHAFGEAEAAAARIDFDGARRLYRQAMTSDPDPAQRDLAAVRLANIEWRLDHNTKAASKDLAQVAGESEYAAQAWIERARMNVEFREDFAAGLAAAQHAVRVARHETDRTAATRIEATAVIEPVLRARSAGRCEGDRAQLVDEKSRLRDLIHNVGPLPAIARLLLDASLLTRDGQSALDAWRGYYGVTAESALLKPAADTLASALPEWTDDRAIGLALAQSKFFTEAAIVLRDPCAKNREIDARDDALVAYAAALRRLRTATEDYYRNVALHRAKPQDLRDAVDKIGRELWPKLQWKSKPRAYSEDALLSDLDRRFGTVAIFGNTANIADTHIAHRVLDEERQVAQYGRTATLHFIELDGVVSNGFGEWITNGRSGDGGWANTAIYQVRPRYAGGPYILWSFVGSTEGREQHQREIADELKRDAERIARDPNLMPRGESLVLEQQYLDSVLESLRASGKSGDDLRAAFIDRVSRDQFENSIWAHEGRHAIDKKYDHLEDSAELEFRAKLSEVAVGTAPRRAIDSIAFAQQPTSPHGIANRRIGALLTAWMKTHASEIKGLDETLPMLRQVDRMTDDQLRAAFRSMDPLAK